ncbi:single-stranded DNA-binding protein [Actinomadura atramentaria]|uniref:single-stranded DNA-binding protein n=1 Tax=Actinomadura atramentaria TaxID=1990 RepID=UPI000361174C|nr:single-stranded DNA-binding protein [Actinomadura atramentaria]
MLNEAQITVTGWVAAEPFYSVTANGTPFVSLRVGCTPRRFDRQTGQWQDSDTMFLTVQCWKALADNVHASEFRRGYPVVVTGRLRIRQYEKDGVGRFAAEIDALTVGPDLNRGTADFRPVTRSAGLSEDERREATEATDHWAAAGPLTAPPDQPAETSSTPQSAAASAAPPTPERRRAEAA